MRHANVDWILGPGTKHPDGSVTHNIEKIQAAILMDLRDELRTLNRIMQCANVAKGFRALAKIAARDEAAFKRRVKAAAKKRVARIKP